MQKNMKNKNKMATSFHNDRLSRKSAFLNIDQNKAIKHTRSIQPWHLYHNQNNVEKSKYKTKIQPN